MACVLLRSVLALSASCSYGMQFVNCALSLLRVGDNFTGFVEFLPAALVSLAWQHDRVLRQVLATSALALWSLRLSVFLTYRLWWRPSVDSRLGDSQNRPLTSVIGFWLIHGSWGFVVSLPVTMQNACVSQLTELSAFDCAGLAMWFVGFVIESWADAVKLRAHMGGSSCYYAMDGHVLWRFTRNPNFFGEFLCWTGLAIMASSAFAVESEFLLASVVWLSPALTLCVMLCEAALLSEWKNNARFGDDVNFRAYRRRTSLFWPCPPSLYEWLPELIRTYVFFDLPCYAKAMHAPHLWQTTTGGDPKRADNLLQL